MKSIIKSYIGICRQETYRLFTDWKIYVCFILYFGVCILTSVSERQYGYTTAIGGLELISDLSNLNKLLVLLAAMPFATSFCDDWRGKYVNNIIQRSSAKAYVLAKVTVCILTSFFISAFGLVLYGAFNAAQCGIGGNLIAPGLVFHELANSEYSFLYVVLQAIMFALVSATYAIMGLAMSAMIPNRFVSVAAPLFMNTVMEMLMEYLPNQLDLFKIQGVSNWYTNEVDTIIFSFMVAGGYMLMAGLVFNRYAKRRIHNEIV